jgi:hypothetical protein
MTKLDDVNLVHYVPPTGIEPYIEARGVLIGIENAMEKYFEDCVATGASHKEIWDKFNQEVETCVEPYQKELDRGSKVAVMTVIAVVGAAASVISAGMQIYDKVTSK